MVGEIVPHKPCEDKQMSGTVTSGGDARTGKDGVLPWYAPAALGHGQEGAAIVAQAAQQYASGFPAPEVSGFGLAVLLSR